MYENLPIILFFEVVKKPDYLIISSSMLVRVNHSRNRSCHSCHSCHWKMQWWSALLWSKSCFPPRKTPSIPRSRSSSWSMAGIPGPWRRFPEWRMHIPSHSSPHQPVCTCLRIRCIGWYRPKERSEKITPKETVLKKWQSHHSLEQWEGHHYLLGRCRCSWTNNLEIKI